MTDQHPAEMSMVEATPAAKMMLDRKDERSTVESATLLNQVRQLRDGISCQADADLAGVLLHEAYAILDKIQQDFIRAKADAYKQHKRMCKWETDLMAIPEEVRLFLIVQIGSYEKRIAGERALALQLEEASRKEEHEKQQERMAEAGITTLPPLPPIDVSKTPEPVQVQGVSFVYKRKAHCLDLDLVPEPFIQRSFNQKAADLWLKQNPTNTEISGCTIERVSSVRRSS